LIILASASPRRAELLKKIIKRFKIIPSRLNEAEIFGTTPEDFAVKAALAKAEEVALQHRKGLVIGADTIVVLGKKILGKPKSPRDAVATLKKLSGKTHKVITGIAVIDAATSRARADYETTAVKMKKIPEREIRDYVKTGKPLDKAGSYGIQEIEEIFIAGIKGDYDNVVGLPTRKLKALLQKMR
jgi:MAF protein